MKPKAFVFIFLVPFQARWEEVELRSGRRNHQVSKAAF